MENIPDNVFFVFDVDIGTLIAMGVVRVVSLLLLLLLPGCDWDAAFFFFLTATFICREDDTERISVDQQHQKGNVVYLLAKSIFYSCQSFRTKNTLKVPQPNYAGEVF